MQPITLSTFSGLCWICCGSRPCQVTMCVEGERRKVLSISYAIFNPFSLRVINFIPSSPSNLLLHNPTAVHKQPKTVISRRVTHRDVRHMCELTRQRDLWLWRQRFRLYALILHRFSLSARRWQGNVLGIARETFDILPKFHRCFVRVKAEANYAAVIWWDEIKLKNYCVWELRIVWKFFTKKVFAMLGKTVSFLRTRTRILSSKNKHNREKKTPRLTSWKAHCVKSFARNFITGQIVDGIFPQCKACSALGKHKCDARCASTLRWAFIVHQHRHASVRQVPILLWLDASRLIQVGHRAAHINLLNEREQLSWVNIPNNRQEFDEVANGWWKQKNVN